MGPVHPAASYSDLAVAGVAVLIVAVILGTLVAVALAASGRRAR